MLSCDELFLCPVLFLASCLLGRPSWVFPRPPVCPRVEDSAHPACGSPGYGEIVNSTAHSAL